MNETRLPQVGDQVSMARKDEAPRPMGRITHTTKSLSIITTSDGTKFYRKGEKNVWMYAKPGVNYVYFLVLGN